MNIPMEQAVRVLEAALAHSGAQDAAHTALQHARAQAAHTAREQERQAERAAAQRQRRQARPLPAEHAGAVRQLEQRRAEREQLRAERAALHRSLRETGTELKALPRWARTRRCALTDTLSSSQQRLRRSEPAHASLDAEIDRLTRQVAQHTLERLTSALAASHRARRDGWDRTRTGELARPRRTPARFEDPVASMLARREPYRGPERGHGEGISL